MKKLFSFLMSLLLVISFVAFPQVEATEVSSETKVIGGGLKKGVFFTPTYLNVEGQRLYVSDSYLNRIQAFIRGNVFQLGFGSFGQNQKEFDTIGGICSIGDKIFVVDSGNKRIQIIDSKGNYVGQFSNNLKQPIDICTDGEKLYILDNFLHGVISVDQAGNNDFLLNNLGEARQLVAIDYSNNNLYISDYKNNEILKIEILATANTKNVTVFSKEIQQPLGLKVIEGKLYVCSLADKAVHVLGDDGKIINTISYPDMQSPFDISFLEDKIIVSDTRNHRVLQFNKNGQFHGLYGMEYDNKSSFIAPISVSTTDDIIMVLDRYLKVVQVFNSNGELIRTCDLLAVDKTIQSPIAIEHKDGLSYLLDKDTSKIMVIDLNGKVERSWGKRGSKFGEMLNPQDFCVYKDRIYVADSGNCRIQIFSLKGEFISQFGNIEQMVLPKSISVNNNKIAVSDMARNKILIFDHQGLLVKTIGKTGSDIGSYLGIGGIFIDEIDNIYIADSFNNRIQVLNLSSLNSVAYGTFGTVFTSNNAQRANIDIDYTLNTGKFSYPTDVSKFKEFIVVVDRFNQRVQKIPIKNIYKEEQVYLSTNELTFGSYDANTIKTFTIYSGNGTGLNATITSKDPLIKVEPNIFNTAYQQVKVSLTGPASGELEIIAQGQKFIVNVFCASANIPSFHLNGDNVISIQDTTEIPLEVIKQNNFNSNISYQAEFVPKNTYVTFREENGKVFVKIAPSGQKYLYSGTYPVKISATSEQIKQSHSFLVIITQNPELVPHVVLGELFTAIWCINCVHSHTAMDRLFAEYGKEKVVFIEYYVQSAADHPRPALSNIESEQRKGWYMNDDGIPDIFFDGTDHLKGVSTAGDTSYEGKEKAMYEAYKKKFLEKLQQPSRVSIIARNVYDSSTNTGTCTAEIRALDTIPYKDPRVYFVLIENNIPYVAINGDKIHHFVSRDMITPTNDNLKDYLGTPISLSKKGDYKEISVTYPIKDIYNIDNLQIVVFVQDNVTKQVLQATQTDIKTIGKKDFEIISPNLYQQKVAGDTAKFEIITINTGSLPERLSPGTIMKPGERFNEEVKINVPLDAPVGSIITQKYTVTNSQYLSKSIELSVEVIKDVPPDFIIELEKDSYDVTAGNVLTIPFKVLPNPKFDQKISLSLKTYSENLVAQVNTEEAKENIPPFDAYIDILFNPTTLDSTHTIDLIAQSGDILKTKTITLNVKKNPEFVPSILNISYPQDGFITNETDLTISGTCDGVTLKINDQEVNIDDNQIFEFSTKLNEGKNEFNFLAKNIKGLETKAIIVVFLDSKKPEFQIEKIPLNVFNEKIEVKGKINFSPVYESKIIFGYIINTDVVNIPDGLNLLEHDKDGNFSFTVNLQKGYNEIRVIGIDEAGNVGLYSIDVYFATKIILKIGNKIASTNNIDYLLEASPYIKNSRTMVPVRFIAEQLGATVDYNGDLQEITISYEGTIIRVFIGKNEAFVKKLGASWESMVKLDAVPEIKNSRTFVPIRFIAETFDFEVNYEPKTQTITLNNEVLEE